MRYFDRTFSLSLPGCGTVREMRTNCGSTQQIAVELLLVSECAARLRLHEETFRRWLREGRIPGALKCGRGWRIPATELERLQRPCQPQPYGQDEDLQAHIEA